jgi:hypothetical protein
MVDRPFIDPPFIDPPFIDPPFIDQFIGRILQHRPPIDRPLQLIDRQFAAICGNFFVRPPASKIPANLVPTYSYKASF